MGELYCEAQLLPPLGRSDHQCILFSPLNQQRHGKAISRSVRTFKPNNLRSLGLKLNLESWSAVYGVMARVRRLYCDVLCKVVLGCIVLY